MTQAISKSTRRNDGHPAQMQGPQMARKSTAMGKSLGKNATNKLSSLSSGKMSKTPGKANR